MHIPVRPVLFLKENRRARSRGEGRWKKALGRVKGGETAVGMKCMK